MDYYNFSISLTLYGGIFGITFSQEYVLVIFSILNLWNLFRAYKDFIWTVLKAAYECAISVWKKIGVTPLEKAIKI